MSLVTHLTILLTASLIIGLEYHWSSQQSIMNHNDVKVIGGTNFWLHSNKTGYDITHPPSPDAPAIYPRSRVETTTEPVTFDPAKTALLVIDMQNYFLSPHLGRPESSPGLKLVDVLVEIAAEEVAPIAADAGFESTHQWRDEEWQFAESLLVAR